jgi:hypothetical protein
MPDLFWCAMAGLLAGAVVSAPVWIWAARTERTRFQHWLTIEQEQMARWQDAYRRLARDAGLLHPEDDA